MLKRTFILLLAFLLISSFSCAVKEAEEQPSVTPILEPIAPTVQPTPEENRKLIPTISVDPFGSYYTEWGCFNYSENGHSGEISISPSVMRFIKEGDTEEKKVYIEVTYAGEIFSWQGLSFEDIYAMPAYDYRKDSENHQLWKKKYRSEYPDYDTWIAETIGEEMVADIHLIDEWLREEKKWEEEQDANNDREDWIEISDRLTEEEYQRIDALYGLEYDEEIKEYFGYFTVDELLNFKFRDQTGYVFEGDPHESMETGEPIANG